MDTKQEKRSPNWQDHLNSLLRISQENHPTSGPFKPGTKTLGYKQMESGERMHGAGIASSERMQGRDLASRYKMHAEDLALRREIEEERRRLEWAQFEAYKQAAAGGLGSPEDEDDFRKALEPDSNVPGWFDLF